MTHTKNSLAACQEPAKRAALKKEIDDYTLAAAAVANSNDHAAQYVVLKRWQSLSKRLATFNERATANGAKSLPIPPAPRETR